MEVKMSVEDVAKQKHKEINDKKKKAAEALMKTLEEGKDGWARFCAYRALKMMSGEDHFCDWIFGSKKRREEQIELYRDWIKKYFK